MCTQFKKTSHPSTICVPCELPQLPDPTQVSELPTRTGLEERYGARLTKHPSFLPQTSRNYDKLVTCLYQVGHFGKRVWYLGCDLHKGIVKNVMTIWHLKTTSQLPAGPLLLLPVLPLQPLDLHQGLSLPPVQSWYNKVLFAGPNNREIWEITYPNI